MARAIGSAAAARPLCRPRPPSSSSSSSPPPRSHTPARARSPRINLEMPTHHPPPLPRPRLFLAPPPPPAPSPPLPLARRPSGTPRRCPAPGAPVPSHGSAPPRSRLSRGGFLSLARRVNKPPGAGSSDAANVSSMSYNKLSAANERMDYRAHGSARSRGALDRNQSRVSANPPGAHSHVPSDNKSHRRKPDPATGPVPMTPSETGATPANAAAKSEPARDDDKHGGSSVTVRRGGFGVPRTRSNSFDAGHSKRHTGGDRRWEAIQLASCKETPLSLVHFRLLKRLGYGDIGSVYLVELRGTDAFFAMKVMDKELLISRNKLIRAETEREILGLLDHPFLPTLYTHFETEKFYCLVMEYCCGGNLHSLRQKQPNKHFNEQGARFYASEVLLAIEYLHMLGIVYRDLKPENVLVRDGGHIMLSDFDLSLRCSVSPMLIKSSSIHAGANGVEKGLVHAEGINQGCMQSSSFLPRILHKRNRKTKSDFSLNGSLLEFNAEPTDARSMSFVGTHEYLAPEIIKGEGHGSAVDWWTLGIFLYELLHGMTPFKGNSNRATLCNVVEQPLWFPDSPLVSNVARDLIRGLLVKDPQKRIATKRGATEVKQHPFFEGVNWALVRGAHPPSVPDPVDFTQFRTKGKDSESTAATTPSSLPAGSAAAKPATTGDSSLNFEYF
ncbi:hypothetical protein ACP4OV_020856 [Aristida adscensionis]